MHFQSFPNKSSLLHRKYYLYSFPFQINHLILKNTFCICTDNLQKAFCYRHRWPIVPLLVSPIAILYICLFAPSQFCISPLHLFVLCYIHFSIQLCYLSNRPALANFCLDAGTNNNFWTWCISLFYLGHIEKWFHCNGNILECEISTAILIIISLFVAYYHLTLVLSFITES